MFQSRAKTNARFSSFKSRQNERMNEYSTAEEPARLFRRQLQGTFSAFRTEETCMYVKVCSNTTNCLREQVLTWVYIGAEPIVFSLKIKARFGIARAPAVLRQFNADSGS